MSPAASSKAAPAIATAIASSHMRIRRQSPMCTMSVIAPIVQKLTRLATAPKTKARAKASQATSAGRWLESGMAAIIARTFAAVIQSTPALNPVARLLAFIAWTATSKRRTGDKMKRIGNVLATLIASAVGATMLGACATVEAHWPAEPAAVEIYDRSEGRVLPSYMYQGRRYVVGKPGNEYSIRVRNQSSGRVLTVMSVDGINAISGDTASTAQTGYVLSPYESADIAGWRKSMSSTAAFYFTTLPDSYAARTGRPDNVGVIGIAVFREQPRRVVEQKLERRDAARDAAEPMAKAAKPAGA